jgi:hypothetical protein
MAFITTLITAITAVSALAPAAFRGVAEHRWLVGVSLLGLSLLHGLHAHAPWLFWSWVCFFSSRSVSCSCGLPPPPSAAGQRASVRGGGGSS